MRKAKKTKRKVAAKKRTAPAKSAKKKVAAKKRVAAKKPKRTPKAAKRPRKVARKKPSPTLREKFDALLVELLRTTGAGRTTLRLDDPALDFDIHDVVAEALAPGVNSLRGQTAINQRGAATAQWIEQHRRLLVQDDLANAEPQAPPALIASYGVKAQMLAPVVREGRLDGWISVHETVAPRRWTERDQAATESAVARVLALLANPQSQ